MPESIPNVDSKTLQEWSKVSYVELCKVISRLFISEDEIPTVDLNGKIIEMVHNVINYNFITCYCLIVTFYEGHHIRWNGRLPLARKHVAQSQYKE